MSEPVAFLSAEWQALLPGAYADLPPRAGDTALVEHTVTGAPGGDVVCWTAFEDGRLVGSGSGARPEAAVTVTLPYAVALEVATGRSDASAAFMQGRAKVGGDQAALLRVLALTATPAYRVATGRLAERTRG
ncbi:MAG TPA: SCP2 sterol-binding domain-containing protein [Acidimicrobiales bacterium]